jgi:pyruvate dehydrogenase E2 component (dihydrolipoamide acetyltransferase)
VESPSDGIVVRHLVSEGDIVPINTPIAVLGEEGEDIDVDELVGERTPEDDAQVEEELSPQMDIAKEPSSTEPSTPDGNLPQGVRASPVARRMVEEHKLDIKSIKGSGPGGRITKKDVEAYLESPVPASRAPSELEIPSPMLSPGGSIFDDQIVPLNRLRTAIGRRMTEAKQQVPHFYVTHEYDMAAVMDYRVKINAMLPEGQKTSVNDYILRAVALTLREFSNLNASINGDEVLQHGKVNLGVAVAVEGGLLTVVCHDTDRKSIRQISMEVRDMVARARSGKVRPDDIEGSTFSVSNLGMYDVEHFIAIINPPEAAILAVGSVRKTPVVAGDQIVVGSRMKATISVDHRVSDGAEAAQFLQSLDKYFEEPLRLFV